MYVCAGWGRGRGGHVRREPQVVMHEAGHAWRGERLWGQPGREREPMQLQGLRISTVCGWVEHPAGRAASCVRHRLQSVCCAEACLPVSRPLPPPPPPPPLSSSPAVAGAASERRWRARLGPYTGMVEADRQSWGQMGSHRRRHRRHHRCSARACGRRGGGGQGQRVNGQLQH